jgi:uncharacterized protein YciI
MHYILFYDYVEDAVTRRAPFRAAHLDYARKSFEEGKLILAGAFADPVDGAALIFSGADPAAAEKFARNDPYVKNGLVRDWRVRKWTTVIGEGSDPV